MLSLLLSTAGRANPNTRVTQHRDPDQLYEHVSQAGYSHGGDTERDPWKYMPPLADDAVPCQVAYPLHFACLDTHDNEEYLTIVEMLLDHGADANARYETA